MILTNVVFDDERWATGATSISKKPNRNGRAFCKGDGTAYGFFLGGVAAGFESFFGASGSSISMILTLARAS